MPRLFCFTTRAVILTFWTRSFGGSSSNCQPKDLSWQTARIKDAYTAADAQNFSIVPAFDMSYHFRTDNCPTGTAWNMTYMSTLISDASKQSATYRWNDAVLVTTRGGGLYGDDYFSQIKSLLDRQGVKISIAPYIESYVEAAHSFGEPEKDAKFAFSDYPSIDGFYNGEFPRRPETCVSKSI